MKRIIPLAFMTLCILAPQNTALAQEDSAVEIAAPAEESGLIISKAYAFATATTQRNGAVFLTIDNNLGHDDRLVSAASNVAETVELHVSTQENGVIAMREIEGLDIKTGESIMLSPTGNHIMLMGLKAPLAEDSAFLTTLTFEKSPPLTIQVDVIAAGTAPAEHAPTEHDH